MIEEIETLEAKTGKLVINFAATYHNDYVTNLHSGDLTSPAIINGKECTWNRKYSIKSYESMLEKLSKAKIEWS